METAIYEALKQHLPAATLVSIGHRPSLRKWHDRQVVLQRAQGEVGQLAEVSA
jgi:putative ATP-binding cassette transporter